LEIEITSFFLDKSIVRIILQAIVRKTFKLPPTESQAFALRIFQLTTVLMGEGYITRETYNILMKNKNKAISQVILPIVKIVDQGKNFKRWARRLTDFNFSYEDAKIISYASFGIDFINKKLGTNIILTNDQKLIDRYNLNFNDIENRFTSMIVSLAPPYQNASLPNILTPEELLDKYS
jgi:hypothetical protein